MKFILLIMIMTSTGNSTAMQEFTSAESCNEAKNLILWELGEHRSTYVTIKCLVDEGKQPTTTSII